MSRHGMLLIASMPALLMMQAEWRGADLAALPDTWRGGRRTLAAPASTRTDAAMATAAAAVLAPASPSAAPTAHRRSLCSRGFAADAGPNASADVDAELDALGAGVFCLPRPSLGCHPCQPHVLRLKRLFYGTQYRGNLGAAAKQMLPACMFVVSHLSWVCGLDPLSK